MDASAMDISQNKITKDATPDLNVTHISIHFLCDVLPLVIAVEVSVSKGKRDD